MFVLNNEIKNLSPMRPVKNSPLCNEEKIKNISPFYDV